jgi:uncharacterized RDD family membrane protein YckC
MAQFWVIRDGERIGPFAEDEVLRGYNSGALHGSDVLWADGMTRGATVAEAIAHLPRDVAVSSPALELEPMTSRRDATASPYAPPMAHVDDLAERLGGPTVYAGFWVRFTAATLDSVVMGLLGMVLGFVLGILGALLGFGQGDTSWLGGVGGLVIGWLYIALTESGEHCASPGKRALRLQVLTADDEQRISFMRATGRWAGRYLSAVLLLIGYLIQPFTARKQALHDILAGTVVVASGPTRRWLVALVLVLTVGLTTLAIVAAALTR